MSYGEQRQLEIALALVTQPTVLLLDEPAAGLSPAERVDRCRDHQVALPRDLTLVLIEHDMNLALGLADFVTCLHEGRVLVEEFPTRSAATRRCRKSISGRRAMLEVRDLQSFYGAAHVIHGVSLDVGAGEVVALLGRNGMGKTTIIRSIMGLAPPQVRTGSVRWKGEELVGQRPHAIAARKIAIVPQGRRLFPSLTVTEHLTMVKSARRRKAGPWRRCSACFRGWRSGATTAADNFRAASAKCLRSAAR